jgi:hypothetical protein
MSGIDGKSAGGQLSDFLAIASVLADPAKVAEEYKKLETARMQAEEVIKLVGPAQEIMSMREQVDRLRNDTQTKLEEANVFSQKVKSDAQVTAAEIIADAQKKAAEIVSIAEDKMRAATTLQKSVEGSILDAEAKKKAAEDNVAAMAVKYEMLSKNALDAEEQAKLSDTKANNIKLKLQDAASQLAMVLNEIAKD